MSRPYFRSSFTELQGVVKDSPRDKEVLQGVLDELQYRKKKECHKQGFEEVLFASLFV